VNHPTDHIFAHTPETLKAWCEKRSMPGFRANQILEWVYQKGVADPAQMSNLSKRDRDVLGEQMTFLSGKTVAESSASDGTKKLLIEWDEVPKASGVGHSASGESTEARTLSLPLANAESQKPNASSSAKRTECVLIPAEDRNTACISSQVGCPVGCKFCASGIGGLEGNLSGGRIVEQAWRLGRLPGVDRVSNIVFMGMGEPLSNFANVMHAVRTLNGLWAMGIGARKITISTVGLPQAIERLADECELPVTLALSLHAPNDGLRRELIPWANFTTIEELLRSCQKWFLKTGREITLEYTLLREVNDRTHHAQELAKLAKTLRANINLIRYNEVEGMPFQRPRDADVLNFQSVLRAAGVNVHIRASRGRDIAAACGQLRHEMAGR
jgi:23S rRNA (adenine2503-C2)-methyltransferase